MSSKYVSLGTPPERVLNRDLICNGRDSKSGRTTPPERLSLQALPSISAYTPFIESYSYSSISSIPRSSGNYLTPSSLNFLPIYSHNPHRHSPTIALVTEDSFAPRTGPTLVPSPHSKQALYYGLLRTRRIFVRRFLGRVLTPKSMTDCRLMDPERDTTTNRLHSGSHLYSERAAQRSSQT